MTLYFEGIFHRKGPKSMKGIQFEYCILGHYANLLLLILELPIRTEVSLSEAIFSNLTMLNGCINKKVNYEIIWD